MNSPCRPAPSDSEECAANPTGAFAVVSCPERWLEHPHAEVAVPSALMLPTEPWDGEDLGGKVADFSGMDHRPHDFCCRAPLVVASLTALEPLRPPDHGITQGSEHCQGCLLLLTGNAP